MGEAWQGQGAAREAGAARGETGEVGTAEAAGVRVGPAG